jgi:hypothetical protein
MMTVRVTAPYATRDDWTDLQLGGVDCDALDGAFGVYAYRCEDGVRATTRNVADVAERSTVTAGPNRHARFS